MSSETWKHGNEFLPFHKQASHVNPDYRDGWNACFEMAAVEIAAERERCAKIVEDYNQGGSYHIRTMLAKAIRKVTP